MTVELTDARYGRGLVSKGNCRRIAELLADKKRTAPLVYGSIGGSITQGACADPHENCYPERFAKWLNKNSASDCKLVNAGIGASCSMFGTFRVYEHLLAHNPDIITIEYAVNDSTNKMLDLTYESLVRKCLSQENRPAVILIFTMNRKGINYQKEHIAVGRHYNLPMLSYRDAIYPDIEAGLLTWEDISPDEVHPNNDGHGFISEMLARFSSEATCEDNKYEIPAPLNPQSLKFDGGRIVDAESMRVISQTGWEKGPHKGGYTGFQTKTPGAQIELEFTGHFAYLGCKKYAGDFGQAEVTLDDNEPFIIDGFYERPPIQAWAGGHTVLNKLIDEEESKKHRLKIKILEERHPDSNGYEFDIGYLLLA